MAKIGPSLYRGYRRRVSDFALVFADSLFEGIGTEVAGKLRAALASGDLRELFESSIDPRSYRTAADFSVDYLAASFLSKYPHKGYRSDEDRRSVAIEKFLASELRCAETNRSLRKILSESCTAISAASVIFVARRKIQNLLGDFSWSDAENHFGFGPGAAYSVPCRKGDPYYKFGILPEATPNCGILPLLAISRVPRWYEEVSRLVGGPVHYRDLPVVRGNRITTVPKNAKTDRIIAIEPLMNMYLQKGVGGLIRSRLRKVGVNLNDQRPNQVAARVGSLDGSLATIDLASASDSIALELVRELLPPDWFAAIEQCRSPEGVLPDGTVIRYQKVSSMGNGFTFELQSLIFWAICRAVGELLHPGGDRRLHVYGDDIVVPTTHARDVIKYLSMFGFETNTDKTFIDGPFRESCGKHYFHGVDVTPVYCREAVDRVPRFFWLHNQMLRWLVRYNGGLSLCEEWGRRLLDLAKSQLPPQFLSFRIPYGEGDDDLGDIGLISSFDEARPTLKCKMGAIRAKAIVELSRTAEFCDTPFLTRQLYMLHRRAEATGRELPLGFPSRVAVGSAVRVIRPTVFCWKDPFLS